MFKTSISTVSIQRMARACALFGAISLLGACGSIPIIQFPGVYKIDIEQGNIVTQEMVDQLRPGMTKRQVTFVMGTPLVRDPFHQDRWDYIYSYQPGGGERGQERLSVLFENDELVSITGDFRPEADASAGIFNAPSTSGDNS
jgi:outer membrane protein assembly factor BamE